MNIEDEIIKEFDEKFPHLAWKVNNHFHDFLLSSLSKQREAIRDEVEKIIYNEQAMGCGLEDLGITNRYEAMRYGYDSALKEILEILK